VFWLPAGVRDWSPVSLIAAMSVASGRAGQGPGGARPPGRRRRRPWGDRPGARCSGGGNRSRGVGYSVAVRSVPCSGFRGAGSTAGCSHPFACLRPGPGPHGAGPRAKGRSGGNRPKIVGDRDDRRPRITQRIVGELRHTARHLLVAITRGYWLRLSHAGGAPGRVMMAARPAAALSW